MFLLDTNVVSELRKTQADPAVVAWARSVPAYKLYISAITLLEIETGILRLERRDPEQAAPCATGLKYMLCLLLPGACCQSMAPLPDAAPACMCLTAAMNATP